MEECSTSKGGNPDTSSGETTLLTVNWDEPAADEKEDQTKESEKVLEEGAVGTSDDNGDATNEKNGDDTKESIEEHDEYGYTKRDPSSSELNKVFIKNIPPNFGFREFRKKLNSMDLHPIKTKKWQDSLYITFKDEAERESAIQKLDGFVWKKKTLKALKAAPHADPLVRKRKQDKESEGGSDHKKIKEEEDGLTPAERLKNSVTPLWNLPYEEQLKKAAPHADPLVRKRKQDKESEGGSDHKKIKEEEDGLTPAERLKNSVTPLWNLPYEEQLKKKQETMIETLKKFHRTFGKNCKDLYDWLKKQGEKYGYIPCELQEIILSPITEGYRNKCEFTIGPGLDGRESVVGFRFGLYAHGTIHVGPPDEVGFLPEEMKKVIKVFQSYLDASSYKAFNPETHIGHWRQLTLRTSRLGHMMAMVDFHPQQLSEEEIEKEMESLKNYFQSGDGASCGITSLYFRRHTERRSSTEWPYTLLLGDAHITESMLDMKFRISPNAFFQVNTAAAEILYTKVAEWCNSTADTTVLDICCGTGTIGQSIAKSVSKVIGIELNSEAVEDAKFNASLNNISNVVYHCGKAEDLISSVTRSIPWNQDIVAILDPPRCGIGNYVIQTIRNCREIKRVVYVSCMINGALNNFLDLIRPQSKRLKGPRFYPVKALPLDLFPLTPHCELLVLFEREETEKVTEETQKVSETKKVSDNTIQATVDFE